MFIDQLIDQKKTKVKSMSISMISQNSTHEEYQTVNQYLKIFRDQKQRKKLLDQQSLTSKVIQIFINQDYSFTHLPDLLFFASFLITKQYYQSKKLDGILFASFFKILELNLGSPTFDSLKSVKVLKVCIETYFNDTVYSLKFAQKIFLAFTKLFITNKYIFLETKKTQKQILLFLFDFYCVCLDKQYNLLKTEHLKKNYHSQLNSVDFCQFLLHGFRYGFLQQIFHLKTFINKIKEIRKLCQDSLNLMTSTQAKNLLVLQDILKTTCILSIYKGIEFKINKNFLQQKFQELITQASKFHLLENNLRSFKEAHEIHALMMDGLVKKKVRLPKKKQNIEVTQFLQKIN